MTTLSVADLTQTTLDGTGVFDVLMRANKAHLDEEFKANRIKGAEYASVYLGSLQAVMNASLQYLLQRQTADQQAELLKQQILLTIQQTANETAKGLNIPKEGLVLDSQNCKLKAEFDLLQSEKLKSAAETALLSQKTATERAQTTSLGVDVDSVVGRQKELYAAQKEGFSRDAEQKAASILIGTWNARRMTDEATIAGVANQLDDATIGRTVAKLLSGVGA